MSIKPLTLQNMVNMLVNVGNKPTQKTQVVNELSKRLFNEMSVDELSQLERVSQAALERASQAPFDEMSQNILAEMSAYNLLGALAKNTRDKKLQIESSKPAVTYQDLKQALHGKTQDEAAVIMEPYSEKMLLMPQADLEKIIEEATRDTSSTFQSFSIMLLTKELLKQQIDIQKFNKASELAEKGDLKGALALYQQIQNPIIRAEADGSIAYLQTLIATEETEKNPSESFPPPVTYQELKKALYNKTQDEAAVILEPYGKKMLLMPQADLEKIIEEAELDTSPSFLPSYISSLAKELLKNQSDVQKVHKAAELLQADDFKGALALYQQIQDPTIRAEAKPYITQLQAIISDESDYEEEEEAIEQVITAQTGQDLFLSGVGTLRNIVPGAAESMPSNDQMASALDGLHRMSRAAQGQIKKTAHGNMSDDELLEAYQLARKNLKNARKNYTRALATGDSSYYMPALKQKQKIMTEYGLLHNEMVSRGFAEDTPGDPEQINQAILQGASQLQSTVQEAMGIPHSEREELTTKSCVVS